MNRLDQIFDVRYGHSLELNRLSKCSSKEGVPFVSRTAKNNGISAFVRPIDGLEPGKPGEITVALGGSVLSTFLHETPFYTGYHIFILSPRKTMTRAELLYYCTAIFENRYRYNYGRQANRTLASIMLPSLHEIPSFVDDGILSEIEGKEKPLSTTSPPPLMLHTWKPFALGAIFDIKKGKRLTKANMTPGDTPFIGATDQNNGITSRIGNKPIHRSGTITVSYNGSVAEAFYQPHDFWASDDVNVLYPKFHMTAEVGLFIATIIRQEKYRFNYGRKWHLDRMKKSVIFLPTDQQGNLDTSLMTQYIQSLPFSSTL